MASAVTQETGAHPPVCVPHKALGGVLYQRKKHPAMELALRESPLHYP